MEIVLFIYILVTITVTGYILLTREKDTEGAITSADAARLVEWAEDGHMPAAPAVPVHAVAPTVVLLPGEEEDKWENLAEDWEFPAIGKNDHMVEDCKYNRALRGCGRRGKGKQKGGKHIDKKKFRRADTKAHLSILELI